VNATPRAPDEAADPLREDIAIARAAAAATRAVPGVERLATSMLGGAATYGRGEVVRGVAVRHEHGAVHLEVHVTMRIADAHDLRVAAEPVRTSVRQAVEQLTAQPVGRIDIAIDDLVFESEGV